MKVIGEWMWIWLSWCGCVAVHVVWFMWILCGLLWKSTSRSSRTETEVARWSPKGWGNIFLALGSLNLFAGVTAALLPTHSSISLEHALRYVTSFVPVNTIYWNEWRHTPECPISVLQSSLGDVGDVDLYFIFYLRSIFQRRTDVRRGKIGRCRWIYVYPKNGWKSIYLL